MPLSTVPLEVVATRPPVHIERFLRTASRRAKRIQLCHHFPAFVSSDLVLAYAALSHLEASVLVPGDQFCEWGSGLGVVCCLAAMTGFRAFGVEASGRLVRKARRLAADFGLPAEFARGNYIPGGTGGRLLGGRKFAWLSTSGRCGYEALGVTLDEFDLIYAYPWPDEEGLVEDVFEGHARPGALLLTYHGERGLWLRRKVGAGRSYRTKAD